MGFGAKPQSPPADSVNLSVALNLASRGIAVFPVQSGGSKVKQPMPFFRWKDQSGTDERTIRDWWRRWPDAVPAIDLGKSGLFVVDADRHDIEHDGVAAWAALMAEEGASPDGIPIVSTPNDGNHWIFRQDGTLGNGRGRLPSGIDVRGSGGYIVAPGAVMADGRCYEVFGDPGDAPPVPSWLTKWLVKGVAGVDAGTNAKPLQNKALGVAGSSPSTDTGSDEIAALLGHIPADCDYETWVSALMAVHAATNGSRAGLSIADQWSSQGSKYKQGEVARKWASFRSAGINGATLAALARQYGADLSAIRRQHMDHDDGPGSAEHGRQVLQGLQVRRLVEAEDGTVSDPDTGEVFDLDTHAPANLGGADTQSDLPDAALHPAGVVGEIADWICSTTTDPVRIHAVGAALSIVGTLISRKVYTEQRPSGAHLYIGCIAPSGMGKQHPQDCIRLALDEVAAQGKMHTGWNVSLPAIAVSLHEHGSRVMIADEFADKLMGIRHKNASTSAMAISEGLRTLWGLNTATWTPDVSLNRGEIKVLRPALGFYGASTVRDFTKSLVSKDITNGLFNRFLILPRFGEVEKAPEPTGLLTLPDRIKRQLQQLHQCVDTVQMTLASRGDTAPVPLLVPFSDAAVALNEENKARQAEMLRASDEDDALALYGRYAEMIKRVALVIAMGRVCDKPAYALIDVDDMKFAQRLVSYSIEQFVLMVRRDMVESLIQAQYKMILEIIRKANIIKKGELTYRVNGRIQKRDREAIVQSLHEAGSIEAVEIPPGPKGGRPAEGWRYVRG